MPVTSWTSLVLNLLFMTEFTRDRNLPANIELENASIQNFLQVLFRNVF